jgi:hypothetical protein
MLFLSLDNMRTYKRMGSEVAAGAVAKEMLLMTLPAIHSHSLGHN